MVLEQTTIDGSHRIERSGDIVTIFDLELFSGFDPDIDEPKSRMASFDESRIKRIVEKTQRLASRRQTPKLILGHTPDDPDLRPEGPAIGDISNIRFQEIGGAPGIVGDVTVSVSDFEDFIKSNRYPRRSAEIFGDILGSVALLGANKPARPLPDTRFAEGEREVVTQRGEAMFFTEQHMPDKTKTDKSTKPDGNEDAGDVEAKLKDENEKLRDEIKKLRDEIKNLKASVTKAGEAENELEALRSQVTAMENVMREQKIERRIDQFSAKGFHVNGQRQQFVELYSAKDSDKWDEVDKFIESTVRQDPINKRVTTEGVDRATELSGDETMKLQDRAMAKAMKRIDAENAYGDRNKLQTYFNEELEKCTAKDD